MHKPLIMINGSLSDHVSVLDRGLSYGQGLFETMRVEAGEIPLLARHLARLVADAPKVLLPAPELAVITAQINQLLAQACVNWCLNRRDLSATVKVLLSAGEGGRGYRAPEQLAPNLAVQVFPRLFTRSEVNAALLCTTVLGQSPIAGVKHCNRLEQVLAANELSGGDFFEGILCDASGAVVEGVSSNVFVLKNGQFFTPPINKSGVNGVMRAFLLGQHSASWPISIRSLTRRELKSADQLFVVNSNWGVVSIDSLWIESKEVSFVPTLKGQHFVALGETAFQSNEKPLGD